MMLSPLSVFRRKKREAVPLAMVALYDAPSAAIACEAGADALLVGDSLANTVLGFDSTLFVTLDDIARHLGAVVRGARASARPDVAIIADLPFATYATPQNAVENAAFLMRNGAHAVKIEGVLDAGAPDSVFVALERAGIPVMGHLGFTPQSQLRFEGVVQGKTAPDARRLFAEAARLEAAGCFAVVLEATTREVAAEIARRHRFSSIGIGAGAGCDGQVLVWHDLVGLSPRTLKFAKAYADTRALWSEALANYVAQVRSGDFPGDEHGWILSVDERAQLDF